MGVSEESDELFFLLLTGLRRDIAFIVYNLVVPFDSLFQQSKPLEIHSGKKVLVEKLGVQWNFDQLRPIEHTVMPRSYIQETKKIFPTKGKNQRK